MLAVRFSTEGRGNCAVVDGVPYVWARTALGSFVLPARCPHRGGPLHLARLDEARALLICPWHGRHATVRPLLAGGPPAVRNQKSVTAVLPVGADTPWHVEYRPVAPPLCAGAEAGPDHPHESAP